MVLPSSVRCCVGLAEPCREKFSGGPVRAMRYEVWLAVVMVGHGIAELCNVLGMHCTALGH